MSVYFLWNAVADLSFCWHRRHHARILFFFVSCRFTRFVGGCVLMGGYRTDSRGGGIISTTPVDHAAALICALVVTTILGTTGAAAATSKGCVLFHLPLTIRMPASELMEHVAVASDGLLGRSMRQLGRDRWSEALDGLPDSSPLLPFRNMFLPDGLGTISGHRHAATITALEKALVVVAKAGAGSGRVSSAGWCGDADAIRSLVQSAPRPYSDAEVAEMVMYMTKDTAVTDQAVLARSGSKIGRAGAAAANARARWRMAGLKLRAARALGGGGGGTKSVKGK